MAGTHFRGPILHSIDSNSKYAYRVGMGMMPTAEFAVIHDDFTGAVTTNVPLGWSAAIIDTGCTITNATLANGQLLLDSDADNEGVAAYMTKQFALTSGKKFFMECRVKQEDVSAMTFQFGLTSLTATTNPEDIWTTVATDFISFGNLDAATTSLVYDISNGGPVTNTNTDVSLSDDTWHTLGIGFNGTSAQAYVDGVKVIDAGTVASLPVGVVLAPFFGMLAGHATTADVTHLDYFRIVSER